LFFQLAARLALFTRNQTYADWAEKTFDWLEMTGFVDQNGSVYEGADGTINCTEINHIEWTATAGALIFGSALMYDISNASKQWSDRLSTILNHTESTFFTSGIMNDKACESSNTCNVDQRFYKGILARNLALTPLVAPFTVYQILPLLQSSAKAAASTACSSSNGSCGFSWLQNAKESSSLDLGSQYSAFEVILSNIAATSRGFESGDNSTQQPNNQSSSSGDKKSGSPLTVELKSTNWFSLLVVLLAGVFMFYGGF